jgi:hypothetical protein
MVGRSIKQALLGAGAALLLTTAAHAREAAGAWRGVLTTPAGGLRLVVKIKPAGAGLEGVIISPDQGAAELPLGDINPDVTALELPRLNHLLQTATIGAAGEYADIAPTVAPSAPKVIGDWVVAHGTPR